jgi:hypothetical protein
VRDRLHKIELNFRGDEEWLQKYLATHPSLLACALADIEGIEPKLRLIGRELEGIDLLFVDERGLLTVVETKIAQNPESRREVVAQLLDYASQLCKWSVEDLCRSIARLHGQRCIEGLEDLQELSAALDELNLEEGTHQKQMDQAKAILANYVMEGTYEKMEKPSRSGESLLKRLDAMLTEGSLRLVIVTYDAPAGVRARLLDIVNYVNSSMQRGRQLVVVELSKVDLQDGSYFIPHLVGGPQPLSAEYYREEGGKRVYRKWDRTTALRAFKPDIADEVTSLIDAVDLQNQKLWYRFGQGKDPSVILGSKAGKRAFLAVWSYGRVTLYSNVGAESELSESQKKKLLELYARTPFLKDPYRKIQEGIREGKRWIEPTFELEEVGTEGQRWKILLDFLVECHEAIS